MCGRFSQLPVELQRQIVQAMHELPADVWSDLAALPARYNLAPTQKAGVLLDDDGFKLRQLNWRLIPKQTKTLNFKLTTINARAESVAKSWTYKFAFRERRCLIPMAGYYEWTAKNPQLKQPWFVHRPDGETLWAAGIWEPRHELQPEDAQGSFAVITTTAQDQAGQVHDRMPVFLPLSEAEIWMREEVDVAQTMLDEFRVPPIAIYAVSRKVNGYKFDDASLLNPIPAEEIV